jgi:hypothetical protein
MSKAQRTPLPEGGEPITPTHVYRVVVYRRVPNTNAEWVNEFSATTSTQTPLGAMRSVLDTEIAKEMLRNSKAVDAAE